ncbi:MAG TPA: tripartite tricarboxylate transporter substrate binding protein [Burkholderiales bacterium]|jgi:tripartite-type tricarboxylate transporter receptor subunit TctC
MQQTSKRAIARPALRFALGMAAGLFIAAGAAAQNAYPNKSIRLVVGFPPGGANDILGRLLGAKMQEAWGQSVVIDNKPGANAIIATEIVAKSPADGYTLLIGASGAMVFNPGLYSKLPYDSQKDFAPVSMVGSFPLVLTVNPGVPVKTLRELTALAKSKPGKLNYSAGSTPFQLAAELYKYQAKVEIAHIPYKGSVAAVQAVMAHDADLTFVDSPPVVPQMKAGKVRGLAVTSRRRVPFAPELPTMAESGMPDYEVVLWTSLFAPAGTPPEIVAKLNAETAKIVRMPDIKERFANLGIEPVGGTPEALAATMKTEIARWTAVAKAAGVKADQ